MPLGPFKGPLLRPSSMLLKPMTPRTPSILTTLRFNSSLPPNVDKEKNLQANDWKSRIPKFPFHKDIAPTIVPKNTPRVGPTLNFGQLMDILKRSKGPELLYMAESHRLYFLACMALTFVCCYNLFDLLDRSIRGLVDLYRDNEEDPAVHNALKTGGRVGIVALLSLVYILAGLTFAVFPTRLIRRIEYLPGAVEHLRLVTHPWVPGKASPVITVPLENLSIGKRAKVWTGEGFYGASNRSSFFFLVFEKGRALPWIVDRSGWFWGDARVYDVLLGKEPVAEAEKGLSYDDMLKLQARQVNEKKAELRRELGPAWRMKIIGKIMQEDAAKVTGAGQGPDQIGSNKSQAKSLPQDKQDKN